MSKRLIVMTVGAILLVGALGVVLGRQWPSVSTPSTTTTVTTPPPTAQPVSAIWPFASTVTRFDSPILAAQAFATAYLGIVDPIMGVYQQGDARSGEVPVRATSHGVITTILVRELTSSHSWWVIGASCPDINLTTPASSSRISSPVLLKGRSIAFEAVVNVELRQDGTLAPLKRDTVRGGSGVIGPFIRSMTFPSPTSLRGALLLRTLSAKDGHVVEASVVRIAFLK